MLSHAPPLPATASACRHQNRGPLRSAARWEAQPPGRWPSRHSLLRHCRIPPPPANASLLRSPRPSAPAVFDSEPASISSTLSADRRPCSPSHWLRIRPSVVGFPPGSGGVWFSLLASVRPPLQFITGAGAL